MKANELRIGNNIYDSAYPKRDARVFRINSGIEWPITYSYGKIFEHTPLHGESLLPIPLTEEWLLKFGFTEAMFDYTIHTGEFFKGSVGILWVAGNNNVWQLKYEMRCTQTVIKYVHQLQNLYFALTGEELTLSHDKKGIL